MAERLVGRALAFDAWVCGTSGLRRARTRV